MEVIITVWGVQLIVEGTYIKPEQSIMYDSNLEGHPGASSDFYIDRICAADSDIDISELLSDNLVEEITTLVIEKIEE